MKKKNILIAFAMLLLTGVALSTASYAWFTANTKLELGNLDVRVTAQNGILMSTDATNWVSILTTQELKAATYTGSANQFPSILEPVSTTGVVAGGFMDMYYGTLQEDVTKITLRKDTEAQGTNGHYIAFDLFIQATNDNTALELLSSSVNAVNAQNPDNAENPAVDAGLRYSARAAFVNNGVDPTSTVATALALDDGTATSTTIWEPNADQHTAVAVTNGAVNGTVATTLGATGVTNPSTCTGAAGATEAECVGAGGTWTAAQTVTVGAATHFGDIAANLTTTDVGEDSANAGTVLTVHQGINKVRVYLWIEGQDIDCENTASQGTGIRAVINFVVA